METTVARGRLLLVRAVRSRRGSNRRGARSRGACEDGAEPARDPDYAALPVQPERRGQTAGLENEGKRVTFEIDPRCGELNLWLEALRATGVEIADITLRTPDLEEVFFKLTGKADTGSATDSTQQKNERP